MSDVQVYSWGLVYASACAPADVAPKDVERAVNASHPTGLDHGWHIADEPFRTGESNPCPCDQEGKQHWLLVC